jgi:beta-glucosidase
VTSLLRSLLLALAFASLSLACISRPPQHQITAAATGGVPTPDLEALLRSMTLEEKIGQMTQVDRTALRSPREITRFLLGSILNGGDSLPRPNDPKTWADTTDALQRAALATRLAIPILYGTDAVHGHALVKGAVVFPHNIGLGAAGSATLVEEVARITAAEVAGTGAHWSFAPCIAVPRDERWGRTYEGFGETPELVAPLGAAAVGGHEPATRTGAPKTVAAPGAV